MRKIGLLAALATVFVTTAAAVARAEELPNVPVVTSGWQEQVLDARGRDEVPLLRVGHRDAGHPDSRVGRHGAQLDDERPRREPREDQSRARHRHARPRADGRSGRQAPAPYAEHGSRRARLHGRAEDSAGPYRRLLDGRLHHQPADGARAGALHHRALRRIGRARGREQRVREAHSTRSERDRAARRRGAQALSDAAGRRSRESGRHQHQRRVAALVAAGAGRRAAAAARSQEDRLSRSSRWSASSISRTRARTGCGARRRTSSA